MRQLSKFNTEDEDHKPSIENFLPFLSCKPTGPRKRTNLIILLREMINCQFLT